MNIYDIFIAYVSWDEAGKRRPVLILEQGIADRGRQRDGSSVSPVRLKARIVFEFIIYCHCLFVRLCA